MKERLIRPLLFALLLLFAGGCASVRTNNEFYEPILRDLKTGHYEQAALRVEEAREESEYAAKDRVLYFLDKGMTEHYSGNYELSNKAFHQAETAMDELFTKSVSKAAASMLLNDNALDYSGEIYENLYLNVFKAINYLKLNDFDGAYVEVRRANDKLREMEVKYREAVADMNASGEAEAEIDPRSLNYYNNVLANYLSHLVYRADGSYDDSRISLDKAVAAWDTYSDVYDHDLPDAIASTTSARKPFINVLAFAGTAPRKEAVGARITTFDNFVMVSDPTNYWANAIPFPGMDGGWNFKFAFPELVENGTSVYSIEVWIDSTRAGEMQMLENMSNVSRKIFELQKSITFFKTVIRSVVKGVAVKKAGDEMRKGDAVLGALGAFATQLAVDLSENADLRTWLTMPGYCFVKEIPVEPGTYDVEVRFLNKDGLLLKKQVYEDFQVGRGLNLVEAFYLD